MRRLIRSRLNRTLFISLLLMALASRALIPTGFMPSASGPFSIIICHGGIALHDAALHDKPLHPGDPGRFDHCQFGAAPAVGPISDLAIVRAPPPVVAQATQAFDSRHPILLRGRAHPPRGPPWSRSYA
jgi:hypothetical protein